MIITVSRQFGSGGRELGKRLADAMGLEYYDREIVAQIAADTRLNEKYVASVLESGGYKNYAFTFARTMPLVSPAPNAVTDILVAQQTVIKTIGEKRNCVIVGRCADAILKDKNPFRIFVYADGQSKLRRCRERAPENERLTDKQMLKNMKQIDSGRRKLHDLFASTRWGDRECYDLMINTSNTQIRNIISPLAAYIQNYRLDG